MSDTGCIQASITKHLEKFLINILISQIQWMHIIVPKTIFFWMLNVHLKLPNSSILLESGWGSFLVMSKSWKQLVIPTWLQYSRSIFYTLGSRPHMKCIESNLFTTIHKGDERNVKRLEGFPCCHSFLDRHLGDQEQWQKGLHPLETMPSLLLLLFLLFLFWLFLKLPFGDIKHDLHHFHPSIQEVGCPFAAASRPSSSSLTLQVEEEDSCTQCSTENH